MSWGNRIISALCALCFAITLVGVGFAAVAVPDTATVALAEKYSGTTNDETPFSHEELCALALAGKRYTFGVNDKGALYQAIYSANESAATEGRNGSGSLDIARWDAYAAADKIPLAAYAQSADSTLFYGFASSLSAAGANAPDPDDSSKLASMLPSEEHASELIAEASERYVLDAEAMRHLDDVFGVVAKAEPVVLGVAIAGVLCAVGVCCSAGRRAFGGVLLAAGILTIAVFAALGVAALVNFDGLFAAFHGLFFSQGSWVFNADSLLITMYPEPFWVGMGAIWLGVTIVASIAAIGIGTALRRA